MNSTKILILLVVAGFGAVRLAWSYQSSNPAIAQDQSDRLVAPYEQPEISDPDERTLREARDKHYERFTFGLPSLNLVGGGEHTDCYAPGVREKLALEKDTMLVGDVINAQAYFTRNTKHVYTEYTVKVNEILKNGKAIPLEVGMEIVTERWGGGVQFPSGEIRHYGVRTLGMPEVGQRYLFILEGHQQEQDFYIWTAFKLSVSQITPIDKLDLKLLPLPSYKGSDESKFLNKVRKALVATTNQQGSYR